MSSNPAIPGSSEFIRSHDSSNTAYVLHKCLYARVTGQFNDDQFVDAIRGTCTEQEFIDAVSKQLRAAPESTPSVMGLINRLYKRGEISLGIVRALEARISRGEPRSNHDDAAIDSRPDAERRSLLVGGPAPPLIEPGRVLRDRYVIEQRLGYGGKGSVFRALDRYRTSMPLSQRYVALKVLHDCSGSRDNVRCELQCAQMLTHPNIVRVFDFDQDGDLDFFTMELLEGELLSSLMARFHPLPMARAHAWSIIGQIASGLALAHQHQVVHADLKPQNIMITNAGEVRILDFGASRSLANQGHAQPGSRSGSSVTSAYACCELLDGRAPDPRDDLYALACIAHELLTGEHPFQRRRANDARDFGVVPVRPTGFSRRQWLVLSKSLSWHRAGRSMSVQDWYKGLRPRREAQRLPAIGNLTPAPVKAPRTPSFRASAVLSLLIITAAIWTLFVHLAPGGKVSSAPLAKATSGQMPRTTLAAPVPAAPLEARGQQQSSTSAMSPVDSAIALSPSAYQVQRGQHFAEIRFHRPANWRGDKPLVWWTEAASAKPGVDYVQQPKVEQAFPKGKNSMTFFVKLLPRAARRQPEVFYIAVADPAERGPNRIKHTAIRLPES
jgi:serine/threonine protein kinase